MPTDDDGWIERVRARFRELLATGHRRLDELEAEREAERAAKPWLSRDGETLDLDRVRSRIEWEEERRHRPADRPSAADGPPGADGSAGASAARGASADAVTDPATTRRADAGPDRDEAELELIRIELDERERASRERLAEIRRELGVDAPRDEPPADGAPPR